MKELSHFLKLAWKVSPMYILVIAGNSIVQGAELLLNVILPKFLIDELLGGKDVKRLVFFGACIVLNHVLMKLLANTLKCYLDGHRTEVSDRMEEEMGRKIMNLEYSYLEDPYYLDLKERAVFAINNQNAIQNLITEVSEVLSGIVTLVGLIAIMATLGPVLIIALAVGVGLMLLIYASMSRYTEKVYQEIIPINRRFGYYFDLGWGKAAQKEIRLFDMEGMITRRVLKETSDNCDMFEKLQKRMGVATGAMNAVSELLAAFSYAYVGIRTVTDRLGSRLSLGSLTMYVSSSISFAGSVQRVGEQIVEVMQFVSFLKPYLEFMSLEEETAETGKVPFTGNVETIEFQHVTFTYPKAEKPVLTDISFSIHKGEKISIVGLNGAGKSTLVKLICRMYRADSGKILINGRDIYEYDYMSYMNTISAVFQDYRLFNFSIEENVSCQEEGADQEKVRRLIDEVGMKEKVDSLPEGLKSRFGREYDEKGIEMSGGQSQKIAIARALYKEASMVILDEPASALDPIAEAEIYEKFNRLVEDKTALYISHRMSSSVFCDRILIIDGGTVADFDTHENLMKKKDSLYYKLFQSQAENYKLA